MQKPPPLDFVAAALELVRELGNIEINPTQLVPTSGSTQESEAAVCSGIDPTSERVSVPRVWWLQTSESDEAV